MVIFQLGLVWEVPMISLYHRDLVYVKLFAGRQFQHSRFNMLEGHTIYPSEFDPGYKESFVFGSTSVGFSVVSVVKTVITFVGEVTDFIYAIKIFVLGRMLLDNQHDFSIVAKVVVMQFNCFREALVVGAIGFDFRALNQVRSLHDFLSSLWEVNR